MEERKTATIVLLVIAVIVIFYTIILPEIRFHGTQILSFKTCTVHFKYFSKDLMADQYRAAENKLALCLCNSYSNKHDTAVANRIIAIYKKYGSNEESDSAGIAKSKDLDSILRNKRVLFDTTVTSD